MHMHRAAVYLAVGHTDRVPSSCSFQDASWRRSHGNFRPSLANNAMIVIRTRGIVLVQQCRWAKTTEGNCKLSRTHRHTAVLRWL
jgi:hypothetical protein